MRLGWLVAAAMFVFIAAACDDGDDGGTDASTESPVASATAGTFDLEKLTATVLNRSDAPDEFELQGLFNPADPTAGGRSFTSILTSPTLRIQSSVVRYEDATVATQDLQRNRQIFPAFGATEENFELDGAEIAFLYTVPNPPGLATWAAVDNYLVLVQMAPLDAEAPDPAAMDVERLREYANTVVSRVQALIDDPSSVTPVPREEFGAAPADSTPVPATTP